MYIALFSLFVIHQYAKFTPLPQHLFKLGGYIHIHIVEGGIKTKYFIHNFDT